MVDSFGFRSIHFFLTKCPQTEEDKALVISEKSWKSKVLDTSKKNATYRFWREQNVSQQPSIIRRI